MSFTSQQAADAATVSATNAGAFISAGLVAENNRLRVQADEAEAQDWFSANYPQDFARGVIMRIYED